VSRLTIITRSGRDKEFVREVSREQTDKDQATDRAMVTKRDHPIVN